MNVRERFERAKRQRHHRMSLRMRLIIAVTVEMLLCVTAAYGVDMLINKVIMPGWKVPLEIELLAMSLLVGVLLTGLLSRYFFKPIKQLRRAMDLVAQGDFSIRLEERTDSKEIKEIYTGFNLMVHELNTTEILQTDFVSNVSHEFKTPISAIEGYSMLLQDEDLNSQQQEYVDKILFNTRRLSTLVGSILLLSKLENQQIPTAPTKFRLDEQIRQSVVALEPVWSAKNVEFDVELDLVYYEGNEAMLHHVWNNLISNSIKFSPEGGLVQLRLTGDKKTVVVTVQDQGPGLTEESRKHMFDKFYQADSSHKQEGNGLGLTLVKRILAMENGEITAENCNPGCCFKVILPVT